MARAKETSASVQIIKGLMYGPKTAKGLIAFADNHHITVMNRIRQLHDEGIIRIVGVEKKYMREDGNLKPGYAPRIYGLQKTPYGEGDCYEPMEVKDGELVRS